MWAAQVETDGWCRDVIGLITSDMKHPVLRDLPRATRTFSNSHIHACSLQILKVLVIYLGLTCNEGSLQGFSTKNDIVWRFGQLPDLELKLFLL